MVRESRVASEGGQESTAATAALMTAADTTAAVATAMARFKTSNIQTQCFSALDGICWAILDKTSNM